MAEVAFGLSPQPSFLLLRSRTYGSHSNRNSSIFYLTQRGGVVGGGRLQLQQQPSNHISGVRRFGASSDYSSPDFVGLGYSRDSLNQRFHLYAGVVSSDSKASTIGTVDESEKQPDLDNSGGAGDGFGDRGGGGGGGGGGGDSNGGKSDNNEGEEGPKGDKKKMALSMSQKLTVGYAALIAVGGVMGFLKSGSQKSLLAGGLSASLLYYVYTQLPIRPVLASSLGLAVMSMDEGVVFASA
ncbi:protein FATTY ACID EXPORT 2, chloroplastic [Quillaja saponaria]|uniref:Protein FATTY ACID EXPORT 2, chloroplastic n=1 Tax=Quillaja saponaria TaxID=32244 RepID=A0AAD7LC65_QUISA|nr:protein FATTY ACID EXPORT 2, chloroplastic [Quillaja saponaria]